MPVFNTDFEKKIVGSFPSDWSLRVDKQGRTISIQNVSGQNALRLSGTSGTGSNNDGRFTWDSPGKFGGDFVLQVLGKNNSNITSAYEPIFCYDEVNDTGYRIALNPSNNTFVLRRFSAGTNTSLSSVSFTNDTSNKYWIKVVKTGNQIQAKVWRDGGGFTEPVNPQISVTDSNYSVGYLGINSYGTTVDYYSFSVDATSSEEKPSKFYENYIASGLNPAELISWLSPDGDFSDLANLPAIWTHSSQSANFLDFIYRALRFNGDELTAPFAHPENYTAMFNVQKLDNSSNQCIASTLQGTNGYFLGWSSSNLFYIFCYDENQNKLIRFFKKLEPAANSIFAFSRLENTFFMYLYDPLSKTVETDFLYFPSNLNFNTPTIRIGSSNVASITDPSSFYLYEFALVNNGIPGFCIANLCEGIYEGVYNDGGMKFNWLGVSNIGQNHKIQSVSGAHSGNTSVALPYSITPQGFSTLGNTFDNNTIVYVNGLQTTVTNNQGYITYSGMDPEDEVIADFFTSSQIISPISANFTNARPYIAPRDSARVFDSSSLRLSNESERFRLVPDSSPVNLKSFAISGGEGLVSL